MKSSAVFISQNVIKPIIISHHQSTDICKLDDHIQNKLGHMSKFVWFC